MRRSKRRRSHVIGIQFVVHNTSRRPSLELVNLSHKDIPLNLNKLGTFPPFLLFRLRRFYIDFILLGCSALYKNHTVWVTSTFSTSHRESHGDSFSIIDVVALDSGKKIVRGLNSDFNETN
jgi:hypothetical protein